MTSESTFNPRPREHREAGGEGGHKPGEGAVDSDDPPPSAQQPPSVQAAHGESSSSHARRTVAIIGGGLAGLAAAGALARHGLSVTLFEARRYLGGRASSFPDPESGEVVDNCQHVGMACCTNLVQFCREHGLESGFRRERVLHFVGLDGHTSHLGAYPWLPAPLHLTLGRLRFLSWTEKLALGRALFALVRYRPPAHTPELSMRDWLPQQGQSRRSIELFWHVVLVSALSETLDRMAVSEAKKVFVDGFLRNRHSYEVDLPILPLGELYDGRVADSLRRSGVSIELGARIRRLVGTAGGVEQLELWDGRPRRFDYYLSAVPWHRIGDVLSDSLQTALPELKTAAELESAPITGVHLWFDRPLTDLPHAVVVGRLVQWIFRRNFESPLAGDSPNAPTALPADTTTAAREAGHYYQVVISASQELAGRERQAVVDEVCRELGEIWPAARAAKLLRWRMVTERMAVFSPLPGARAKRPEQATAIHNLFLAGDWTQTGWPATMESAVRSGYLAAEAILAAAGERATIVAPELKPAWLSRVLLGIQ